MCRCRWRRPTRWRSPTCRISGERSWRGIPAAASADLPRQSTAGYRASAAAERFLRELAEVVRKDAISKWLETPNEACGHLKPVEVMERGEMDRLWRMLYFLGSGQAG